MFDVLSYISYLHAIIFGLHAIECIANASSWSRFFLGTSMATFMLKFHNVIMTDKHVTLHSMNDVILGNAWILKEM